MRVAIVHDYIKEYGGAERVLEALHEIWPDAPIFTTVYLPEFLGPHKEKFKDWDIRTSFLQYIPFKEKLISPFRIIAPFVFKMFDLSQFDVVIVSATGAYTPNTIRCHPELVSGCNSSGNEMPKQVRHDIGNGPIHICYCHTPPRYLYGYATARDWKKNIIFRAIGEIGNHFLRLVDYKSAQNNVDYFIANSKNVAERIKKFYRRSATVIYPPIDVDSSMYHVLSSKYKKDTKYILHNTGYYLAGGRLARPKHIDLIVRACQELKVPLKVFGKGFAGYDQEFKIQNSKFKITSQNSKVDFVGEVSDEEKLELMRNAKAYIFASEDEDFGITPLEAMGVGTPVIVYRSGGVVESVIDEKTGLFFDELTVEGLKRAIQQFNNLTINPPDCIKQAQKFSKENFKKEIKKFVYEKFGDARRS